jgi:AT-rich interactive domain-containing protein 1
LHLIFKASGDEIQQPPTKSRKGNEMMYNHPMTPNQANASPGASGHPLGSGEDFEMGSPPWPRTPASPVFNSHAPPAAPPQESYRSSKVKVSSLKFVHIVMVI